MRLDQAEAAQCRPAASRRGLRVRGHGAV